MARKPNETFDSDLEPGSIRFDRMCEAMIQVGGATRELDDDDIESLREMIEHYHKAPADEKKRLDEMVFSRALANRAALRLEMTERALNAGRRPPNQNSRFPH